MKFLSAHVSPCPGQIKSSPQDFLVQEIPAYSFGGTGDHTYVEIEKTGISTFEAIRRLCQALSFPEKDVGYAGLKDAVGVTRQWLSFEHVHHERFEKLEIPKVKVLNVSKHTNKYKRGHLFGNRFEVVLRGVPEDDLPLAYESLSVLGKRGVPNWYDTQRFGRNQSTARLGMALLKRDYAGFFSVLLGSPDPKYGAHEVLVRRAYDDGKLEEALQLWPSNANSERQALKAVIEEGPTEKALHRIPQRLKLLYVNAAQSLLFNRCLEQRFDELDKVWEGDLAVKLNGAFFTVEDPAVEQPRAEKLEISPSGPIFGTDMVRPKRRELELEQAVLCEAGLTPESFKLGGGLSQGGDRRAYRFPIYELGSSFDRDELALHIKFVLPKGCYATVVLREVTKDEDVDLTMDGD